MKTNRVANLLVASILLTLISAGVKYYNVSENNKYTSLITQAHEILRRSTELQFLLTDADNCTRAFEAEGDSSELQSYRGELPLIQKTYDTLLKLTAGSLTETNLLKQRVRPHISSFIGKMNAKIDGGNLGKLVTANQPTDSTRMLMQELKKDLQELSTEEESHLRNRTATLKRVYAVNNSIHFGSFILICIISGLALKTLLEKEKRNKELVVSLNEANKNLELNVHERTADLEKKSIYAEKLTRDLQDNFDELQSFYDALHESNAKAEDTIKEMRDLYDNAPTGYHSLTADGLIVRMNQTELNWLGYSREEVVGKMHVTRIIAEEEHESYKESFTNFLKQGYARNIQHTFVRKDGSKIKVLLNATAIYDAQGKYVMSRGVTYLQNQSQET